MAKVGRKEAKLFQKLASDAVDSKKYPNRMDFSCSKKFLSDVETLVSRGWKIDALLKIVKVIRDKKPLPDKCQDHLLTGNVDGIRDCHVGADWVLLYKIDAAKNTLIAVRTGSHSDLGFMAGKATGRIHQKLSVMKGIRTDRKRKGASSHD